MRWCFDSMLTHCVVDLSQELAFSKHVLCDWAGEKSLQPSRLSQQRGGVGVREGGRERGREGREEGGRERGGREGEGRWRGRERELVFGFCRVYRA